MKFIVALFLIVFTTSFASRKCLNHRQIKAEMHRLVAKTLKANPFLTKRAIRCTIYQTRRYINRPRCRTDTSIQKYAMMQQFRCRRKFSPCLSKAKALEMIHDLIENYPKQLGKISDAQEDCIRKKVLALRFTKRRWKCAKELDLFRAFNLAVGGNCLNFK